MASIREMQGRIHTVESIEQMTRALQAVSASQVRTVKELSENTLPYTTLAWQVLTDLKHEAEFFAQHRVFMPPDETAPVFAVFVSADRGLAGSFPMNILKEALQLERKVNRPIQYITVGKKGRDMLQRRNRKIIADFSDISSVTSFHDIKALSTIVTDDFDQGHAGQVYLIFTEYESISHFKPTSRRLLPFADDSLPIDVNTVRKGSCLYEGDPNLIINSLLRRYVRMELFHAITSSKASEYTSRMLAMNDATEKSEELLQSLHLEFNRVRQSGITNDILDIMGGANIKN